MIIKNGDKYIVYGNAKIDDDDEKRTGNTMTEKEYKIAKEQHENADELDDFLHLAGIYFTRYMTDADEKNLRKVYKEYKNHYDAINLDGFNGRALLLPFHNINGVHGILLMSYNTPVCMIYDGDFIKLWSGFSVTTLKHVNILRENGGLAPLNKRAWIETPTADRDGYDYINANTGEVITPIFEYIG